MGESNDADQWPPKGHCACKDCGALFPTGTSCGDSKCPSNKELYFEGEYPYFLW